jgi:hypothetical protein
MMIANNHDQPERPDLIPMDEAEATRRFEAVRDLDPAALAGLDRQELLLAWLSFFWLNAALHPDDAEVWPDAVADARPLADEALRRYEAGEIEDGDYYPAESVRQRILHERAKASQAQPRQHNQRPRGQAAASET